MALREKKNKGRIAFSPGDMECLNMALTYGADAIYLAGQEFGMRTASANFPMNNWQKAVQKSS